MMTRFQTFLNSVLFPSTQTRIVIGSILGVAVPGVYLLVYMTGGIKFVYSHTMYIPIVLIGVIFGLKWGIITAIAGSLLLGPLMPIDTVTGEPQIAINWLYRAFIFILIGAFSGYFSDTRRKRQQQIISILSRNQDSGILLFNSVDESTQNTYHKFPVFVIRVLNQEHISDRLGIQTYHQFWQHLASEIETTNDLIGTLYQIDNRMFAFVTETDDDETVLHCIISIFQSSHHLRNISLYMDIVIGYTKLPESLLEMIRKATIASRFGELNHILTVQYSPSLANNDISLQLLADMRDALRGNQLFLEYQTLVDAKTKKVTGLEALIRWQHPTFGLLPPLDFIPIIEQCQLIHEMTLFVCKKVKHDIMSYALKYDLFISINLTTKNLYNETLINQILSDELFTQEEREHLVLEITESSFITNPDKAVSTLHKIKNYGIKIALDDFGTGYSSLSYLGKYPLDIIKVDRSFVQNFSEKHSHVIIQTAINLSRNLDYKIIVEGVESEYLAKELSSLHCDILQGFYFSKPQKIDIVIQKLAQENKLEN